MKRVIYYSVGFLFLLFNSFSWNDSATPKDWTVIHSESNGPITFSMQIKSAPNMSDSSWISLEVLNETGENLQINNAICNVSLSGMNQKGKIVSEGFFNSVNASEIFDLPSSPNPFAELSIPSGIVIKSNRISTLCTSILGYNKETLNVFGELEFFLELEGKHRYYIAPEKITFSFEWHTLSDLDKKNILIACQQKLSAPGNSSSEIHQLADWLSVPGIEKDLTADELLTGLSLRRDVHDGRQAITQLLARSFAKDPLVKTYYQDHVLGQDYRVLEDLKLESQLWSKDFLPPLVQWLATANNSTKYRILETLYTYKSDWENKKEIVNQLSSVIEKEFGTIIKSSPEELNQRALVSWAAAVHMWSLTTDHTAIAYLKPFLTTTTTILGSELLLDHNSYSLPRPTRVCDVAIESILRLEGKNLEKTYASSGFRPPYLHGEAPIVIKRIRNNLIEAWSEKNAY